MVQTSLVACLIFVDKITQHVLFSFHSLNNLFLIIVKSRHRFSFQDLVVEDLEGYDVADQTQQVRKLENILSAWNIAGRARAGLRDPVTEIADFTSSSFENYRPKPRNAPSNEADQTTSTEQSSQAN